MKSIRRRSSRDCGLCISDWLNGYRAMIPVWTSLMRFDLSRHRKAGLWRERRRPRSLRVRGGGMTESLFNDQDALAALCRAHGIRRLSLFGSVLKGVFRPDSDVDFLVEFVPGSEPGLLGLA